MGPRLESCDTTPNTRRPSSCGRLGLIGPEGIQLRSVLHGTCGMAQGRRTWPCDQSHSGGLAIERYETLVLCQPPYRRAGSLRGAERADESPNIRALRRLSASTLSQNRLGKPSLLRSCKSWSSFSRGSATPDKRSHNGSLAGPFAASNCRDDPHAVLDHDNSVASGAKQQQTVVSIAVRRVLESSNNMLSSRTCDCCGHRTIRYAGVVGVGCARHTGEIFRW